MADTTIVRGYAAASPGAPLAPTDLAFGPLADDEVELEVECSGICHSDLSMLNNDWQMTTYPFIGGHEVIGKGWVTSSPTGGPTTIAAMLEFCARHRITAQCEHFPMKDINVALDRLRNNRLRYRAVVHAS
jgi:D-arabinose 1-dehydrogenase-like Zn-dependent alcohol dehydrogenase